jgi:hypothetical protein
MPFSAIGVFSTRASPNSVESPSVTLYVPPHGSRRSSPMQKTRSSRCISSRSASLIARR